MKRTSDGELPIVEDFDALYQAVLRGAPAHAVAVVRPVRELNQPAARTMPEDPHEVMTGVEPGGPTSSEVLHDSLSRYGGSRQRSHGDRP